MCVCGGVGMCTHKHECVYFLCAAPFLHSFHFFFICYYFSLCYCSLFVVFCLSVSLERKKVWSWKCSEVSRIWENMERKS